MLHRINFARVVLFLSVMMSILAACTTSEPEDGRDDAFLGDGGKDDTGGVVEGSRQAVGVLRVANELTRDALHDRCGLSTQTANNIVSHRSGVDGVAGTADDQRFTELAELDAVPYVGPIAFGLLLTCARDLGYVSWGWERVLDGGSHFYRFGAMAYDSFGELHVVYCDNDDLQHARKDNAWSSVSIEHDDYLNCNYIDLIGGANGELHMVGNGKYYKFSNGAWSPPEEFKDRWHDSRAASVALDGMGNVHIGAIEGSEIIYAYRNASGWHKEVIDECKTGSTRGVSFSLLPSGDVAIAYTSPSFVRFARRVGENSWSTENIDLHGLITSNSSSVSMELDPVTGDVGVVYTSGYYGVPSGSVKYAERVGGSWTVSSLGPGRIAFLPDTLATPRTVAISHFRAEEQSYKLSLATRRTANTWSFETIMTGFHGPVVDSLVDPNGNLWILQGDYTRLTLLHQ